MPFNYDDPYTKLNCKVLKISQKAVQIEDESGTVVWVPRSCVHGGDDRLLDGAQGDDIQLQVRRWFAEKEGLL